MEINNDIEFDYITILLKSYSGTYKNIKVNFNE